MNETNSQEKVIEKSNYSLTANMFLAFIITFAAGTVSFEGYMPEKFITIYSSCVTVICFATWLVLSFISGNKKKWQFAIFSSIFWILPNVIIWLANGGPEVFRKSIIMYLLSELAAIVSLPQLELVGGLLNLATIPFTVIVVLACIFCYLGGYITSDEEEKFIEYD